MKVIVINGSPKGKKSVTLQSVEYLKKHFADDCFEVINVGLEIKKLRKPDELKKCIDLIIDSDMLLFCYPVYICLVPYQLYRFIELLKSSMTGMELAGKYATQITTSKHFYDVTAHRFVDDNCNDLGLRVLKGFSADMTDLLGDKGRKELLDYWKYIKFVFENKCAKLPKNTYSPFDYTYVNSFMPDLPKKDDFDTLIVTNCTDKDEGLDNMIKDFRSIYTYRTRLININDFKFSGGCRGCFNCATDGKCTYRDGFDSFLRENINNADTIIYAAKISDHYMGASFKIYEDRQFCNGHRPVLLGMPVGYILSGDYGRETNLRDLVELRAEVGHNFLAGVASDESCNTDTVKQSIENLAKQTAYALENKLILPQNFSGVGGMKVLRDLVYEMQGLMKEDYRFYKRHNFFDFPQKQVKNIIKMKMFGFLLSLPYAKKYRNRMYHYILEPYKKVIRDL